MNTFADWLFNLLLWSGIVTLLVLSFHVFAGPILGTMTVLIALAFVVLVSLFWPRY